MFAGFLAMAVLLLAGGLVTVFYTYRLQNVTAKLLAENLASLKVAQELEVALFGLRGLVSNYMLNEDPRWLATLEQRKKEWETWMDKAKATARTPQEQVILENISALFVNYAHDLQTAIALHQEDNLKEAKAQLFHASREVFEAIYQQCEAFITVNEDAMYAAQEKIQRTNRLVRTAMYGLGFAGVFLGGLLGWIISRSIVNPIYELVLKIRDAAGDELVERVGLTGGTEIEELDRQVHTLIDRINTAVTDLEKNRRLLSRAEKLAALGKVAASVAHEIRNPLTAIKMLIYSMHEQLAQNDQKRRHLAVILKEIDRLERFVHNFLQFARPPDPVLVAININETVHETLTLLAPRLRQNGVDVREVLQPNLPKITADADQVKQVVMNLVLNAAEAMPKGGRLAAETRQAPATADKNGKACMQIRIRDSGCGIPEELLDSIFDPFVSGRKDGTGLGLSVAYQIVHLHSGWIEAANNPEGGATFTVSLPVAPSLEAAVREV